MMKEIKNKNLLKYGAGILICVVIISIFLISSGRSSGEKSYSGLAGIWSIDGYTRYEFQDGGRGALLLPDSQYDFQYRVKDNVIAIDFTDEAVTDAEYTFSLEGDTLLLETGEGKAQNTYTLTREAASE